MKEDKINIRINKEIYNVIIRFKKVIYKVILFVKVVLIVNNLKTIFFSCFCYILALVLLSINNR